MQENRNDIFEIKSPDDPFQKKQDQHISNTDLEQLSFHRIRTLQSNTSW
jgi:hypothetical protein